MTSTEFVKVIKEVVYDSSIKNTVSNIQNPRGKHLPSDEIKISQWYNNLSDQDKGIVKSIIKICATHSVFGFFAVIDGVRQIEKTFEKGKLELRYLKGDQIDILNDQSNEYLHDIFNGEIQE